MRAVSTFASITRHLGGVVTQALLIAAIVALMALLLSPVYRPADWIAGTEGAAAGGKQTYELAYGGFRVWNEPYALADFTVTRSRLDTVDVWVKAHCVDASGAQAIPGADPYGHVKWNATNPLVGHATLDSVKKGSTCEVWLTKAWRQSTDAAPGWPETYLVVDW
jgi:hypothetical protein